MDKKKEFMGFDKYTVAIICPLEVELSAARFMLDEEHQRPPEVRHDPNRYLVGRMSGHSVVLASLPAGYQGIAPAATVARDMERTFRAITVRLLVGIGGGIPFNGLADVRLGDVVVSMPHGAHGGVVEYDFGKVTPNGFQRKGFICPTPKDWLHVLTVMQSDHRVQANRITEFISSMLERFRALTQYKRPSQETDILFEPNYDHATAYRGCGQCDRKNAVQRLKRDQPDQPWVHYGLIASGHCVIKDGKKRDIIGKEDENILCIEMEAAGVMNDFPCVVIRGISDYADSHKANEWQAYAAAAAAGLAKELLTYREPANESCIIIDQQLSECMRDLRCTDPRDDKSRIESSKDPLVRECYDWVLGHPAFLQWRDDSDLRILWIKGNPGKGKTMLMIGLIKELSEIVKASPEQGQVVVYFFCQSTDERLNGASSMLRGLIYLLVAQKPELGCHALKRYSISGSSLFESSNASYALWAVLLDILQDPRLTGAYLLIDALDECSFELSQILELLKRDLCNLKKIKLVVASRYHYEIQTLLEEDASVVKLDLELNEPFTSEAVRSFIDWKLSRLPLRIRKETELMEEMRQYLHDHAQGTFLWVALVCKRLRDAKYWKLKQQLNAVLEEFPPGLRPLYERMLKQMQELEEFELCCQILSLVPYTFRPLHLTEIGAVSGLPKELHSDLESLHELVALCGSFLIVIEDRVHLIHLSAKEYLTTPEASSILGNFEVHGQIAARSLETMKTGLKKNISRTGSIRDSVEARRNVVENRVPAYIHYPCGHWIDHLIAARTSTFGPLKNKHIYSFCTEHILHWLEALAAMGQLSRAVLMISALIGGLANTQDQQELICLLKDASKFLLRFRSIIETAPTEIYNSALIFSPLNSIIRQRFIHEISPLLRSDKLPAVESDWTANLFTLERHRQPVSMIAFSPNGKVIASGSVDGEVRTWDAATGGELLVMNQHSEAVSAGVFAPDGAWLATGGDDDLLFIWNALTGAVIHMLSGHTDRISQLVLCRRGSILASASWDCTIRVWDPSTGSMVRSLLGHIESVEALAFSQNGKWLASGSHDGVIIIWNALSGDALWTSDGHSSWIRSLAFSNDDKYLISGSGDGHVKMSIPTTGAELHVLNAHKDMVTVIRVSPDSTWCASASCDHTVCVWDLGSGKLLHHLKGHTDLVFGLDISYDGRWLASGSSDTTTCIWDPYKGTLLQTLRGHLLGISQVAFSPDGRQLATAAYDSTIRVWDPTMTTNLDTPSKVDSHSGHISVLAFSPSGSLLASGSYDTTARIWDVNANAPLYTLRGHSSSILSVAFSSNDELLASGSNDDTIKVWELRGGKCLKTLAGHSKGVDTVLFSPSNVLASGSGDRSVRIWNVTTGSVSYILTGHTGPILTLQFLDTETRLVSGSEDGTVRVWDVSTGSALYTLEGHSSSVTALAISPRGLLVSASTDKSIKVWDRGLGGLKFVLNGHSNSVRALGFSADGRYLVSASFDDTVRIWDVDSQKLLRTLEGYSEWLEEPVFLDGFGSLPQPILDSTRRLVILGGKEVIYLPMERRGQVCAYRSGCFVLGHRTGGITFLNLIAAPPMFCHNTKPTLCEDSVGHI